MKPRPTGSAQAHARRIHAPAPINNRDLSNQASTVETPRPASRTSNAPTTFVLAAPALFAPILIILLRENYR
jgi:hypothetical protein